MRTDNSKMSLLAAIALLWLATIDVLNHISLGPISLSGLITLSLAGILIIMAPALILTRHQNLQFPASKKLLSNPSSKWLPAPLGIFAVWAVIRTLINPSIEGVQNTCVYVIFIGAIASTALGKKHRSLISSSRFHSIVCQIALASSSAFILTTLAGYNLFGPRSFALVGLIFLSVLVVHPPKARIYLSAPYFVIVAIGLSLSRTATIIGGSLLVFLAVQNKARYRNSRMFIRAIVLVIFAGILVTQYAPIRDRFIVGDAAYAVGDIQLNTSGRSVLWKMTIDSANLSPFVGHGPGSAAALISSRYPNIGHPHNEYLRLYHDFGYMGLIMFSIGYWLLIRGAARRVRVSDSPIHWCALLALLSVAAAASTDNAFVYPFVMLPLGVLVGFSMTQDEQQKSIIPSTRQNK